MGRFKKTKTSLDADLLTLRSLIAVVDFGSFSAAAKQIGRSQSAVSLQIAKLEERMQVRLLERTSRSVKQTPAGETFLSYARRIIQLADEGFSAVTVPNVSEPLRIGFAEYLVPQHLQLILSRFRRAYPKTKLELHLGSGFDLHQDLLQQKLDIVVAGPEGDDGLILMTEPLVWVGPQYFEPDGVDGSVGLILMQPPCSYRQAAFDALTAAGRAWHVAVNANSIQAVQSAVAAGLGVSVLARSAVNRDLMVISDVFPKLSKTSINAFWHSTKPHPLTKRFVDFLKEELGSIGEH